MKKLLAIFVCMSGIISSAYAYSVQVCKSETINGKIVTVCEDVKTANSNIKVGCGLGWC